MRRQTFIKNTAVGAVAVNGLNKQYGTFAG